MLTRIEGSAGPLRGAAGIGVSFSNSAGLALAGELLVPEGAEPCPAVVIVSGGRTRLCPESRGLATALLAEGLAAFNFDCTGCGESEGRPEQCTAGQQADDIGRALEALVAFDEVAAGRIAVAGIGEAGTAVLAAAARGAAIRAVALFAAGAPPVAVGLPPVEVPVLRVDDAQELALAAVWLRKRLA